jgi:hypothetical protein
MNQLLFTLFLTCISTSAFAQSAFRCEEDGRVVYQSTACPGGRPVTGDARAEADRALMLERKRRDESDARKAEAERRTRQEMLDRQMVGTSTIKPTGPAPQLSVLPADGKKAKRGNKGKASGRKGVDPALFGVCGLWWGPAA